MAASSLRRGDSTGPAFADPRGGAAAYPPSDDRRLPYCEIAGERGRLYAAICDVLALDLAAATTLDAFREAVVESAASIQARQATDSIPFVDDIRTALHALASRARVGSAA